VDHWRLSPSFPAVALAPVRAQTDSTALATATAMAMGFGPTLWPQDTYTEKGKWLLSGKRLIDSYDFSYLGLWSNMVCITLISARWPLSTSVAKLNSSASCPAPAESNKSFTMLKAPLWC
jgi:hypothetical protein